MIGSDIAEKLRSRFEKAPTVEAPPGFRALKANSNFNEAQLIGLADPSHSVPQNMAQLRELVAESIKPGDIYLIEGTQKGVPAGKPFLNAARIPDGVVVLGWDNKEAFDAQKKVAKSQAEALQAYHAASAAKSKGDMEEYRKYWTQFKETPLRNNRADALYNAMRNASLRDSVQEARRQKSEGRVFIFAGSAHFIKNPGLLTDLKAGKYIILEPQTGIKGTLEAETARQLRM